MFIGENTLGLFGIYPDMNVLSLFDGMSGAQIALERAKIPVSNYYASEIDKFSIKIAQKNYPETIQLGDISNIDVNSLPKIDLLIGGSPCQGFSFAGKRLNFDDPRSKLFFLYAKILKEVKPKYFILENVSMKKESRDIISKNLGVEPLEINSNLLSAQNRKRLYWTNIPLETPEDRNIYLKDIIQTGFVDRNKSYAIDASYFKGGSLEYLIDIYTNKYKRQIVFEELYPENITWRMLTPIECERLQTVPDNYTEGVSNTQRYKMLGNSFTVDVIAHILKGIM